MNLLLDTHVFLWYINADPALPTSFRDAIKDPSNEVYLSVAAVWEAVIKYQLGKLPLPQPPEIYLPAQRAQHRIASLNIDETAVAQLANLPNLHRDPFDRIMIAQARERDLMLVTVDDAIRAYPVKLLAKTNLLG